ncbi:MAG: cell division protein CrgA [Actinomycetota bacterium]
MARQNKSGTGRTTPKGDEQARTVSREPMKVGGRFDAVIPVLMLAFLGLGTGLIMANYLVRDFLGMPSNWYLLGGLGLILAGIVTATQWR